MFYTVYLSFGSASPPTLRHLEAPKGGEASLLFRRFDPSEAATRMDVVDLNESRWEEEMPSRWADSWSIHSGVRQVRQVCIFALGVL